jgi:hypothetical protein
MSSDRLSASLRSAATISVLVAAVFGFGACSDSSPSAQSGAGPNPAPVNGLVPPAFAELPKPGSAHPIDAPTSTPHVISQSYEVTAMNPAELATYYFFRLPRLGWTPSGTQNVGGLTTKSVWVRDHLRLDVVTTGQGPLPGEASLDAGSTQLDLVLTQTVH